MIYLDNAATTWPKPKEVVAAMNDCINEAGANPGRGGHKMALAAGRIILEVRESLARLFKVNDPGRIVFTGNATESLNLALKGLLQTGDHIITSSMEHNAMARPIHLLKSKGIEVTEIECSPEGFLDPDKVSREVKKNTRAVAVLHASNVTGTIMPVEEIGRIARENGISFILDAAQTAGVLDIDVNKMNIDMLAFTGHKGLYGPQGTGGLYIRDGVELEQIIEGGTGSNSESLDQPQDMPDKFESGTPNTPGLAGLGAGIMFLEKTGIKQIRNHERNLLTRFIDGLKKIKGIELYGSGNSEKQVAVVSINVLGQESSEIAFILDNIYNIACRSGLHCSPMAHKTMGTLDRGAVRFSFSYYNTFEEMDFTLEALAKTVTELT